MKHKSVGLGVAMSFSLVAAACGGGAKKSVTVPPPVTVAPPAGEPPADVEPVEPLAVGYPSSKLIPRELLFGNPSMAGVQVSPNGKFLSWRAAKDGVMNIWVAPVGDLAAARAVTNDTTRPVREYFWTFGSTHIVYMQDAGGDENFHAIAVDMATGTSTDLTPIPGVRAMVLGVSARKPGTILVGLNDRNPQLHDVYSIDLKTAAKTLVYENKEGFAGFVVDDDLAVRMAVRPNTDGSMDYLSNNKAGWEVALTVPADDAQNTSVLGFNKKGDSYYLADSRGRDTTALFSVPFKSGKSGKAKLIAEDPRVDLGSIVTHPTENTIQAVGVDYERNTWKVIDKKVAADYAALAKVAPGDFVVVSKTTDDKHWVVAFHGDRQPTSWYMWDRSGKKPTAKLLFVDRPELADQPLVAMHPVIIPARDGLKMVSYLSLPTAADPDGDGKANSPVPMVLLVHGGPWARDEWGSNPLHQLLANRGYAVLSVNFRGSTGFGKAFINAGNGEWGKAMHTDLLDAVDWAVEQGVTPRDQVAIAGGSYGGYATLAGLTLTPDVFACGVDIVGPSSIVTLLESIPPYWAPAIASFKRQVGDWTTPEGKAQLLEVSPISHVAAIKKPLLIGQGANDPRVKQAESDQIVAAMKAAKIPVSYVLFPDEGHGFARPENSLAFWGVTEAFLSAHLGGTYQPLTSAEITSSTITVPAGRRGIPGFPQMGLRGSE